MPPATAGHTMARNRSQALGLFPGRARPPTVNRLLDSSRTSNMPAKRASQPGSPWRRSGRPHTDCHRTLAFEAQPCWYGCCSIHSRDRERRSVCDRARRYGYQPADRDVTGDVTGNSLDPRPKQHAAASAVGYDEHSGTRDGRRRWRAYATSGGSADIAGTGTDIPVPDRAPSGACGAPYGTRYWYVACSVYRGRLL